MKDYQFLMEDEKIIARGKNNLTALIPLWIIGGLLFFTIVVPIVVILTTIQNLNSGILLTNKRVIGSAKIGFGKSLMSIPLNKIQSVSVNQPPAGRALKYGMVTIGTGSGRINFATIKEPEVFKLALMQQIEYYEQGKTSAPSYGYDSDDQY